MTAVYEKRGIRFLYPENWELTDSPVDELPRAISVQSPQGGFWSLHVYEKGADPSDLADELLEIMKQEYDSLESQAVREPLGSAESVGYDMEFYCLDLVVSARARGFRLSQKTCLVLAQAETRDFDKLADVFQAITLSMLSGRESPARRR